MLDTVLQVSYCETCCYYRFAHDLQLRFGVRITARRRIQRERWRWSGKYPRLGLL
jgi:hypothetical protein